MAKYTMFPLAPNQPVGYTHALARARAHTHTHTHTHTYTHTHTRARARAPAKDKVPEHVCIACNVIRVRTQSTSSDFLCPYQIQIHKGSERKHILIGQYKTIANVRG